MSLPSPAPGELDLSILLRSMQPILQPGEFVFCTVPAGWTPPSLVQPIGQFLEPEGLTLILSRHDADALGLPYGFVGRMITLMVHSSLDAVGFLAAIATHLADQGISTNAISAYYHDHLFVPGDRADEAIAHLVDLAASSRAKSSTGNETD